MTDMNRTTQTRTNEQGIAIVLALFLMAAASVVAASLMFLSQTETYSSMNYRLMSQARYGAESGIQKTVNYLLNSYTAPGGTNVADPLTNYNVNVSPVTRVSNGLPVILSANSAVTSNYPIAAVQTAFSTGSQGTLAAGNTTVTYAPYATLLSMQEIAVYGGGLQTVQTWQITSNGSITAGKTAQVEVTAVLESQKTPAQLYAAFATGGGCGALLFGGGAVTDSYDSSALVGGVPVISNDRAPVGTNGNLGESGNAVIHGSLSSPRVGVGSCSSGNVDALSSSGGATVDGGVVRLPAAVVLPAPAIPVVPTTAYAGGGQTLLNGASVGNVDVANHQTLTLCSVNATCTININSINLQAHANIQVAAGATVILNVAGAPNLATPIDLSSGAVLNSSFDPSKLQIQYAGTGLIKLTGGAATAAMVYAPNASATFTGGGDFYGSIVVNTLSENGGAHIHYDRHLVNDFFVVGNPMMSSFSWKKY
jgi:hypothetical protein